jgi:hypothetical protein
MRMGWADGELKVPTGLEPGVSAKWVPMWFDQVPDTIIEMHRPLAQLLRTRWSGC